MKSCRLSLARHEYGNGLGKRVPWVLSRAESPWGGLAGVAFRDDAGTNGLGQSALTVGVLEVGGLFLKYLMQIVLARFAGSAGYGFFSYSYSWAQLLAIPTGLGLPTAVIRFTPEYVNQGDWSSLAGLHRRSYLLTLQAASLVALFVGLGAVIFAGGENRIAILAALLMVPLLAVAILQEALILAVGRTVRARVAQALVFPSVTIGCVLGVALLVGGQVSGISIVACTTVALAISVLLQRWLVHDALPILREIVSRTDSTRAWLRVSVPLSMVKGFQLLLTQTDVILIGLLIDFRSAGIYAAAAKSTVLMNLPLTAVTHVAAPRLGAAYAKGDFASLRKLVRAGASISFLGSLVMAGGLVMLSGSVLALFGESFQQGSDVLAILALGRVVNGATGPTDLLLNLAGQERNTAKIFASAAVVNVLLNLLLIPWFGLEGAAGATTATMVLWNIAVLSLAVRRFKVSVWPMPKVR